MTDQPTETVKPMTVVEFDEWVAEYHASMEYVGDVEGFKAIRAALVEREQLLRENAARLDNIQRIARANEDGSRLPVEAPGVAD